MRLLFALLVLLVTAVLSAHLAAVESATVPSNYEPPDLLGDWTGCPEQVDDRSREVLGTDSVQLMRYRRGADEVLLARAESAADRRVAHPPEVCLRAAGYEILMRGTVPVPGVEGGAIHLDTARRGVREQVLYWFEVDGGATGSYLDHQLSTALRRLYGGHAPVALIRLTTTGERADGLAQLLELATLLHRSARPR